MSAKSSSFGPVATEDRLILVDVLRGFALLGIAFVNMSWFSLPNGNEAFEPRLFQETYNRVAAFLVMLLFGGKANSIFSFLFGLGLTIQMQRADASGQPMTRMIVGAFCAIGVGAFFLEAKPEDTVSFKEIMSSILYNLNRPLLCIGYIGGIVLLWRRASYRKFLRVLAPAGTMPLTNCIMQSVLATLVFYSYGLGYFGRLGPLAQAGISLSIFIAQAIASAYWVEHFQYGPLEWLWRYASYGKRPTFRRPTSRIVEA